MLETRVFESIEAIGRETWDACFPGALEGYDYLAAVEAAGLQGFEWRYLLVEADGRPVAAAPAFFTDYRLDTTLTDLGRRIVALGRRLSPRAFTVRMACLGSPCTEDVCLGFASDVAPEQRGEILRAVLVQFELAAAEAGCWLLAVKDAPAAQGEAWAAAAGAAGYQAAPGMPSAELPIRFADLDAYLAGLGRGTRRDMRRKLRALEGLRVEVVDDLTGLEPRILELYRQTRERSPLQFEDLTEAYFTGVLARMRGRVLCVLYWAGEELIGFNLLLHDGGVLLDKFFCMDGERGPASNLYFVSWFVNVRLCIERGLGRYQSGQAAYADKLRLGSRLLGATMYFRHRRPVLNTALKWAAPLLASDPVPEERAA